MGRDPSSPSARVDGRGVETGGVETGGVETGGWGN
jgi:hypothetical protein